jgi:hemerythrin superfamily protein
MKAQELRINNWVFIPGIDRYVKVSAIYKSHFRCEDSNGVSFDESLRINYHPIPLTPEILEKCGFIEKLNRQWSFGENQITHDYMITVRYSKIIDGFYYQNAHFRLRHLHQLQNLYFALTGEELEFKP